MEVGDRLLINEEEVIFKGWVDQSQTAIEVKGCDDESLAIKKIFAKEIRSLGRSRQDVTESPKSPSMVDNEQSPQPSSNQDVNNPIDPQVNKPEFTDHVPDSGESEETEDIPEVADAENSEPNYNAWEVWTYLERQRVKTLKLLNTFQAEWEANRFVREAERSTPPTLRVHYEVRPIVLSDDEVKAASQNRESPEHDQNQDSYDDAIDVEVVSESL
ncbi:MAG: hypothetical protein AUK48_01890 [Oscillatoriales cyanobacterium CG2_30_44_21]|nr:MAG: hypothetical protein AUK48_01890 [Oscillatoriales cyanobacterium CG2_30_44_21]